MSGITGAVWTAEGEPLSVDALHAMQEALARRGPHAAGEYRCDVRHGVARLPIPGVALGHRRLEGGDAPQPAANEDESVWGMVDGVIDNHAQLRHRLEGAGHRFRGDSPAEILAHLYEDEGPGGFALLEGCFAAAVWDANRRQLALARDRLGQRPLVYCVQHGRVLFASEIKALLAAPDVPRELAPEALDEYLTYGYVPHSHTMFRGIEKLPPGYYGVYGDGRMNFRRYWQPDLSPPRDSHPSPRERLREALTESVRAQADGDPAVWLSGDVDSAIIAALLVRQSDAPVRTLSLELAPPGQNGAARVVAEQLGVEHQAVTWDADLPALLEQLVEQLDEPLADPAVPLAFYLASQTGQTAPVVLTGSGADELFAGYARHRQAQTVWDRMPPWLRRALAPRQHRATEESQLRRRPLAVMRQRSYLASLATFDEAGRGEVYDEEFLGSLPDADPFDFLHATFAQLPGCDPLTSCSLVDMLSELPCAQLAALDGAAAAHGLVCRHPFLARGVVDAAIGLPARWKDGRSGKRIVREAFRDLLPRPVLRRPHAPWRAPLASWLRGPLQAFSREVLLHESTLDRGYFRPEAVQGMLGEHIEGRADYGQRLWAMLILELWHRRWLDG